MEEKYSLCLMGRGALTVGGVLSVTVFQEDRAEILCRDGTLQITGEGLHLDMLSPEREEVALSGRIDSMYYPDEGDNDKKSLFSRLFS